MTSLSSVNNAALLILQQTNDASNGGNSSSQTSPADDLISIVNRISSETSPAKTKASSAINGALLDLKAKQDSTVQAALDFIDSDNFKSSDPTLKETLKKLITENSEDFAKKVRTEHIAHAGISIENAIVNALQETITENRDKFSSGEIVLGIKSMRSVGVTFLPAVDGSSTHSSLLMAAAEEKMALSREWWENRAKASEAGIEFNGPEAPPTGGAAKALQDWTNKWFNEFGFDRPA